MKRIVFLTCIGTLALSLTALGAPNKPAKKTASAPAVSAKGGGHSMSHAAPMARSAPTKMSRDFSGARMRPSTARMQKAPTYRHNNVAVNRDRAVVKRDGAVMKRDRAVTRENNRLAA